MTSGAVSCPEVDAAGAKVPKSIRPAGFHYDGRQRACGGWAGLAGPRYHPAARTALSRADLPDV